MWYRFHGYAGPGHQSSWEAYVWLEGEWDASLLAEVAEEHVPDWARDGSNITKEPEAIDRLPPEEHASQVERFERQLKTARHMLSILAG